MAVRFLLHKVNINEITSTTVQTQWSLIALNLCTSSVLNGRSFVMWDVNRKFNIKNETNWFCVVSRVQRLGIDGNKNGNVTETFSRLKSQTCINLLLTSSHMNLLAGTFITINQTERQADTNLTVFCCSNHATDWSKKRRSAKFHTSNINPIILTRSREPWDSPARARVDPRSRKKFACVCRIKTTGPWSGPERCDYTFHPKCFWPTWEGHHRH